MDALRKRVFFRAHHMGSIENDLLFGRFADDHLAELTDEQVERFQRLLEAADTDLYNWATGFATVPPDYDSDVMRMIRSHAQGAGRR